MSLVNTLKLFSTCFDLHLLLHWQWSFDFSKYHIHSSVGIITCYSTNWKTYVLEILDSCFLTLFISLLIFKSSERLSWTTLTKLTLSRLNFLLFVVSLTLKIFFLQVFFFFFSFFCYLNERKIVRESTRLGQRERDKQVPYWAGSPTQGWIPGGWYHDLSQRQTLNWLSHPGTPQ